MKVVMVVLDAFPNDVVSRETTPTLWGLIAEGGWSPAGGIAELTAATYPNHATFVTGVSSLEHGIVTNRVRRDEGWISSAKTGPSAPTLFDACARSGRRAVAAVGDQNLIGVCGADASDEHWPPGGRVPDGAARNRTGYLADDEVLAAAGALDLPRADFAFVQLDSVDAVRHLDGAASPEALQQCRDTDAALGRILEPLRPIWEEVAVFAVSDHDQEDLLPGDPLDLRPQLPDDAEVEDQGTASLVLGDVPEALLRAVPGVEGVATLDERHRVVWGAAGQRFGTRAVPIAADHGSPRTRTQVAVVGGGAPRVATIARTLARERPAATRWAAWARDLLDLP